MKEMDCPAHEDKLVVVATVVSIHLLDLQHLTDLLDLLDLRVNLAGMV